MKLTLFSSVFALICIGLLNNESVSAQTAGIESGAIYKIRSQSSNKMLNSSNSALDNNVNVDIWTDTDSDAERWTVVHLGSGIYTLRNVGTNKFLHTAANPAEGVNVDQYDNTNDNRVRWAIVNNGDGTYAIRPAGSTGFSLDVYFANTADGTNVQLWANNTSNAQKWTFTKVSARPEAPTAAIANQAFNAWNTKYNVLNDDGFWGTAEMFEIILDAYETTGLAQYKNMIGQMYNNFISHHGTNWMSNEFNDDIMWMTIACVRAYLYTGNQTYLDRATYHFAQVYSRAWTSSYGGGLLWKVGLTTKNACINGPAIVAACYLFDATQNSDYLNKAQTIYAWQRSYLYDQTSGAVWDSYNGPGNINYWSSTYNQGAFLGAAVMLHNITKNQMYYDDAVKIANFTRFNLVGDDVINFEEGTDIEGFKGIFVRYARRYIVDFNKSDYIPWLKKNAKVAYNNRNTQSIISTKWKTRTPESANYYLFNTSTAVSLLINCPLVDNVTKNAFSDIQAEDFDYIKGPIVEGCPDGTDNLGGVVNGNYSGYNNVNFGSLNASKIELRVSNGTSSSTSIEIRLGSPSGTLIGTASVPATGGWHIYTTVSANIAATTGLKNVYLVYKGSNYVANINYFKFIEGNVNTSIAGTYYLQNRHSNLYLDIDANHITENGCNAQQWSFVGSANQQFNLNDLGNGYYSIINVQSGKAIDVSGVSSADGANVHQWDYVGGGNQKFFAQAVDNGYYKFIAQHSNKIFEVGGFNTQNGGNIQQWTDVGQSSGQWKLVSVSTLKSADEISSISSDENQEIRIYPVPVQNTLNISGVHNSVVVEIFSLTGNLVKVADNCTVNVSELKAGIYVIRIVSGNNTLLTKFIKE
ncbi:MAG: RICIN domain-containing protein [Bacteroidales bacterium]|nr:RICIN domain-containing protein [Bacteroidales bacterium]